MNIFVLLPILVPLITAIGVLLAAFYLISFSDLAFAWSTTLNLDAETFHSMLNTLSWPWHIH